jgi:predicted aldo/keto reductase-like oxidoreductase
MRGTRDLQSAINMYRKSFENLHVDYIDYYFAHNIGNHAAFKSRFLDNGLLNFIVREKEAGRIKNLGWTFHGDGDFFEWMSKSYPWDMTLVQLNYLDWDNIVGVGRTNLTAKRQYDILCEHNTPIWVMEPLLGGQLARPHFRARERMLQANPDVSPASWAFRFVGSLPNVTTVLSGMTFMNHLQDNIHTYSPLVPLSDAEREMLLGDITQIALQYRTINCTRCQYCMPCPYGIDIPEIFSHYNRSMNEGNYPDDRQSEDFKRARRAFLVGMDRRVSPFRQAGRCINCDLCRGACPQRINIASEMRRIDKFTEELKVQITP